MTRARETLTLFNRRDDPIPYLDDLRRPGLVRRRVAVAPDGLAGNAADISYTVLGMGDIFLDFAGRKHEKHLIHRSLARLRAHDTLRLDRNRDGRVQVLDAHGVEMARLSSTAAERWQRPQLEGVDKVRVLAMVCRRAEDCRPEFREHVVVPSWEVPILEVRHRRLHLPARGNPTPEPALAGGSAGARITRRARSRS